MKHLRIVILQVAALQLEMNAYKDHPMFYHEVLHSEEFKAFAVTLRGSFQATPMAANVLMQQVVPIIEEQLSAVRTDVSRLYTLMLDKTQSSSNIFSQLRKLVSSSQAHNEAVNRLTREQIGQAFSQLGHSITSSATTNATSSITSSATTSGSDDNPEIQCSDKPPSVSISPISLEYNQPPNKPATDETLMISSQLESVRQVWTEYRYGFLPNHSIQYMESKYGASWRKSSKASQHVCRRKWIWIAIETLIEEGVTEEKAVRETDNGMKEMKKSLKQAPVMFGRED